MTWYDKFSRLAKRIADAMGHPISFISAFLLVILWAITGPYFNYSDTWQLIANTATTLVTFLLGFLILNTANRDSKAEQLKLDELILAINKANDSFIKLEEKSAKEVVELEGELKQATKPKKKNTTKRQRTRRRSE